MQGNTKNFLKPKLVDSISISDNKSKIVLQPLEKGFGYTLGNSLRRVLLSSIVGSAISEISIEGVNHEFSTISGVQEDVLDIMLNLKEAAISLHSGDSAEITIEKTGPYTVTVKDIGDVSSGVSVYNPNMVIATVNEGAKLSMRLKITTGIGYVPASSMSSSTVGGLLLDANYSPIKQVVFSVEATRIGQNVNLDKLIIYITTNGSVNGEEAVKRAANYFKRTIDVIY